VRAIGVRTLAILGLGAGALVAACSFPDVTFRADASVGDGAIDGTGEDVTTGDGSAEGDGGLDARGAADAADASDAPGTPADAADASPAQDAAPDVSSARDAMVDAPGAVDGPNCDCAASAMLPTNLSCLGVGALGCTGSGFKGAPACGTSGQYLTCSSVLLACSAQDAGTRVQECQ